MRQAAALLMVLVSAPAGAAVYEVGDDGAMIRIDSSVVVAGAGAAPAERTMRVRTSVRAAAFHPEVDKAGQRYDVSPALIDAIAHVESRYDPAAVSRTRAMGIMQLMPGTARDLGVDARDPAANIRGGTAYIRMLLDLFDGDLVRTIAAYNAGPGAVKKAGGVPNYPETKSYVAAVMNRLAAAAQ